MRPSEMTSAVAIILASRRGVAQVVVEHEVADAERRRRTSSAVASVQPSSDERSGNPGV